MSPNEILLAAAKRIETKGWLQGCYAVTAEGVDGTSKGRPIPAGSPCGAAGNLLGTPVAETDVIGAIRQVGIHHDVAVLDAKAKLLDFLHVDNLADWNDEPRRTKKQVIAALNGAAAA